MNKIEKLYLSVSTYNALKRAGINFIHEIEQLKDEDLMRIRNINSNRITEIKEQLKMKKEGYRGINKKFDSLDVVLMELGKSDSSVEYAPHLREKFNEVVVQLNHIKGMLNILPKNSEEYFED